MDLWYCSNNDNWVFKNPLYLASSENLAKELYCSRSAFTPVKVYLYKLGLDIQPLNILDFTTLPIENWLSFLYQHKSIDGITPLVRNRLTQFKIKFTILNSLSYDLIKGYRLDNSNYRIAVDFLNVATTKTTVQALLDNTETLHILQSQIAFNNLFVLERTQIQLDECFYQSYINRDVALRRKYKEYQEQEVFTETILDLL